MSSSRRTELEHAGTHIRDHFKSLVSEALSDEMLDLLAALETSDAKAAGARKRRYS